MSFLNSEIFLGLASFRETEGGVSCPTCKILVGFPLFCGLLPGVLDQELISLHSGCLGGCCVLLQWILGWGLSFF